MALNQWLFEHSMLKINSKNFSFNLYSTIHKYLLNALFFSANHHVNIRTNEEFSTGQRIYIFGKVRSTVFRLDDGKMRNKLIIKAIYDQLRNQGNNQISSDQNEIKIQAEISSNIEQYDTYSAFTLKANYTGSYV